jgi:hypothetical protein
VFVAFQRAAGRALPGPAVAVRSRHTPAIEQLTLNWRPISILTRSSVHRWSSQPCAAGPLASSFSSRANRSSDSFGSFAGPFDFRPSIPPSRQSRRHCSTERSLTRRSLAMSEVLSPRANLCPASSRIPSRAARRSAVRPPPSAYRITPAYHRDHPTSPPEGNPKRSVTGARPGHVAGTRWAPRVGWAAHCVGAFPFFQTRREAPASPCPASPTTSGTSTSQLRFVDRWSCP